MLVRLGQSANPTGRSEVGRPRTYYRRKLVNLSGQEIVIYACVFMVAGNQWG